MNIVKVQYIEINGVKSTTTYKITLVDGRECFCGENEDTVMSNILKEWIDAGNTIEEAE